MQFVQNKSYLKKAVRKNISIIGLSLLVICIFYFSINHYIKKQKNFTNTQQKILSSSINLSQSSNSIPKNKEKIKEEVTFLILGLDSRKGDARPRCDAIHLITFSPPKEKIIITSVPRGIHVDMDGIATPSAYIGNSCHIKGIDWAVEHIEKITNLKPDYLVKINFSQACGLLRILKLPTTPTLQFLRDRKSFYYGDNQRSHNQALFIKDTIINHIDRIDNFPRSIKHLAFKLVPVKDLDFQTAQKILNWSVQAELSKHPEKIELVTKPNPTHTMKDLHFSQTDYPNPESWQNDKDWQKYQKDLISYLENLAKNGQDVTIPFSQQLWLQVEDEKTRNQIHYELLKAYCSTLQNKQEAQKLINDFIEEMELSGENNLTSKAKELL